MKQLRLTGLTLVMCFALVPLMPSARALNPQQQSFDVKANYIKSEQMNSDARRSEALHFALHA